MRVGSDNVKKAMAQLLKQEYATLKFKDGESVEDFPLHMQSLISKLRSHGVTIDKKRRSPSTSTLCRRSTSRFLSP